MEAPEKIWVEDADRRHTRAGMPYLAFRQPEDATDTEYTRSDLCTMPGELVEAIKRWPCPSNCDNGAIPHGPLPDGSWEAEQCQFCDERSRVLAWHEGKG